MTQRPDARLVAQMLADVDLWWQNVRYVRVIAAVSCDGHDLGDHVDDCPSGKLAVACLDVSKHWMRCMCAVEICQIMTSPCGYHIMWFAFTSLWRTDKKFRAKIAAEVPDIPPETPGLDVMVQLAPKLVFIVQPHEKLSSAAMRGRKFPVHGSVWGTIPAKC